MVPVLSLGIPVLLSAVIVFIGSSIMHMVLRYHRNDLRQLSREDEVMAALRTFDIQAGDYALPWAGSPDAMKRPEFIEKVTKGPVAFMTVIPSGPPSIGTSLVLWFIYSIVVSVFAGYVTGRALGPGATYLEVFRFAGTTAFMGYSLALLQDSIWHHRNWGTTFRMVFDGLIYALLTAGTFGWLWPR
jgi:hypothetical protein